MIPSCNIHNKKYIPSEVAFFNPIECTVLQASAADPDPGSGVFVTPGFRIRDREWKKVQVQDPGSGINIPDLIFENLVSVFLVKNA